METSAHMLGYHSIRSICLLFSVFQYFVSFSQEDQYSLLNDGPYIFIDDDQLFERSVIDGTVSERQIDPEQYPTQFQPESSIYYDVSKIVALSDIHGQYDLMISLLQSNKIIDDKLNWSFGEGHMVIVGDIFDRGEFVTEILWFFYHLERKAAEAGGKVHYLLGNHEYMVFQKNFRYIHEKYVKSSELLESSYDQLFGQHTVLGRWLRSKATMIRIDDKVFVHGGFSSEFLDRELEFSLANDLYRQIIDLSIEEMKSDSTYLQFHGSLSPIWYRGYFVDEIDKNEIDDILNRLNATEIIVGHTSKNQIVRLYDGKVYGVDSSIKRGKNGELLFINGDRRYRGTLKGTQLEFNQ